MEGLGGMFLSIIAGVASYMAAQLLWYAPFAFGPEYLRTRGITEDETSEIASKPGYEGEVFASVIVPAFLMSMALVTLKTVTDQFIGTNRGFLFFSLLLGSAVSVPKYIFAYSAGRRLEQRSFIQEGAFLLSFLATVFAIIGSRPHIIF